MYNIVCECMYVSLGKSTPASLSGTYTTRHVTWVRVCALRRRAFPCQLIDRRLQEKLIRNKKALTNGHRFSDMCESCKYPKIPSTRKSPRKLGHLITMAHTLTHYSTACVQ